MAAKSVNVANFLSCVLHRSAKSMVAKFKGRTKIKKTCNSTYVLHGKPALHVWGLGLCFYLVKEITRKILEKSYKSISQSLLSHDFLSTVWGPRNGGELWAIGLEILTFMVLSEGFYWPSRPQDGLAYRFVIIICVFAPGCSRISFIDQLYAAIFRRL